VSGATPGQTVLRSAPCTVAMRTALRDFVPVGAFACHPIQSAATAWTSREWKACGRCSGALNGPGQPHVSRHRRDDGTAPVQSLPQATTLHALAACGVAVLVHCSVNPRKLPSISPSYAAVPYIGA